MGKSFGFSPSEKLTVCHFIYCIFTFSKKKISEKRKSQRGKMNFQEKKQTGTRKKSEKFSSKKEKRKTAGKKEARKKRRKK